MTASIGAVRVDPAGRPLVTDGAGIAPQPVATVPGAVVPRRGRPNAGAVTVTGIEIALAETLAGVLGTERVALDSDFFDDLGADSMTMAHFCARVRKRGDLPPMSIKDVYRHPSIAALAAALASTPGIAETTPVPATRRVTPAIATDGRARALDYLVCAVVQAVAAFGYLGVVAVALALGIGWVAAAPSPIDVYLRTVALAGSRLRRPQHPADRREMAPRRALGRDELPRLEHRLRPLLDRPDARPAEPDAPVRRLAPLRAVPPRARGAHRTRRHRPVRARAGLHGPADDR